MRVGCDLDNVLVDIIDSALEVMAADLGIDPAEVQHTNIYWDPFTHPDPTIAAQLKPSGAFWDRHDVLSRSLPLPGAFASAWALHRAGLLACYITRRPAAVDDITTSWLASHGFPPVPVEHVGSAGDEDYFARCKSSVCARYGVTHMIDDHPSEADLLAKAGVEVILVDAPVGRAARQEFLRSHPHVRLASNIAEAARLLLADQQKAA